MLTRVLAASLIVLTVGCGSSAPAAAPTTTVAPTTAVAPTTTAAPATVITPPAETVSQVQAKRKAASDLNVSGFSCSSLIEQLHIEGFSQGDAEYGALSTGLCVPGGAVAKSNAAERAAEYLGSSSFSCRGLIEQLLYEKFSQGDAEYGAFTTGICG